MSNAARIAPGRTHAQHRLSFYEDDVPNPEAGKVISSADAHAAAADYDYFCGCLHGCDSLHEIRVSTEVVEGDRSERAFRASVQSTDFSRAVPRKIEASRVQGIARLKSVL